MFALFEDSSDEKQEIKAVTGALVRVIYHQNGFLIGLLDAPDLSPAAISVKGPMLNPAVGLIYRLQGEVVTDKRYGPAFRFTESETQYPTDESNIRAYLESNCKWIGPAISGRIWENFGDKALDACKSRPEEVAFRVKGITRPRADEIAERLKNNEDLENIQIELNRIFAGVRVPRAAINQLIKKYDKEVVEVIRANPYKLTDFHGIGFLIADTIASRLGIEKDSPYRIQAGLTHVLNEAASGSGHTYLPTEQLLSDVEELLAVDMVLIAENAGLQITAGVFFAEPGKTALTNFHEKETAISWKIKAMLAKPPARVPVGYVEKATALYSDQTKAVLEAFKHNVFILTGAPGTGKTYTVRQLIESLQCRNIALAAPTGKAAVRLQELTGYKAQTIHRLLEPKMIGHADGQKAFAFIRDECNPLDHDAVIVDEASMIDVNLFASLVSALRNDCRLILVGDLHQLPPVGPGNILRDMLAAGVPSVELTEIKRQNPGNIILNCHRIKNGETITLENSHESDFFWADYEEPEQIRLALTSFLTSGRLEKRFKLLDILRDVQVISPLREKTALGCKEFNNLLQGVLNGRNRPESPAKFWLADKVIQLKNDYELGIINGDIGFVKSVSPGLVVEFDNPRRLVSLEKAKNNLGLAYAVTVHKYQGSEAPVILMPFHSCFGPLIMQRNLVYTAISRATSCFIGFGDIGALRAAVARNKAIHRYTFLREMLADGNNRI